MPARRKALKSPNTKPKVSKAALSLPRALSLRQALFVAEYLANGLNATQAAISAGYARKAAAQQGCALLTTDKIRRALAERHAAQFTRADLSADRVLEELRRIAFLDPLSFWDEHGNLRPIHTIPAEARAALAGFEVIIKNAKAGDGVVDEVHKIKFGDKLHALELLAKHFALLTDVSEIRISGRLTVEQVGQMSDGELAARLRESLKVIEPLALASGGSEVKA